MSHVQPLWPQPPAATQLLLSGGGTDLSAAFQTGLDIALTESLPELTGRRFGLLFNQASLTADGRYAADALSQVYGPSSLVSLFSPQHGVWGEEQANMIETGHSRYRPLDLPLYSLYSHTRKPTDAMLAGLDALVIDLQDVGTRVYTFIWTMLNCLEACAERGITCVVLDRPPYEYETVKAPIDILAGSDSLRLAVDNQVELEEVDKLSQCDNPWCDEGIRLYH